MRLTVLRVGFKFKLAMARVRTPAPSRLLLALLAGYGVQAMALPQGGQVVSGNVTIKAPQNGSLNVVQTTNKGIVDWQSFNVGSGEKVNFLQPGATSSTLNRIVGSDASTIFGQINANGQVFLINPNGVLFAPGSAVNASGLVASTLQLQDADYLAGRYTLSGNGGAVDNRGVIKAGFAVLAGSQVSNTGTIVADGGTAALLAGGRVTMNLVGSDVVSVSVDAPTVAALVRSGGIVQADGGQVVISAKAADALLATVVNVDGIVQAHSIGTRNGTIVLDGGSSGTVDISGKLDASGRGAGQTGGTVKALGQQVGLFDHGAVDVSGDAGGGIVRVGGDWHGEGAIPHASQVYVASNATITADAVTHGNGGNVVLWSDDKTQFFGHIDVHGGALSGDGGAVETSSHGNLQAFGVVAGGAKHGKSGYWLLDPDDLTISGTQATDGGTHLGSGIWTTSNANATLSTSDLNASITAGSSIEVRTTGGANHNGNITVDGTINPSTLVSGDTAALTLNARGNIEFTGLGHITTPAGASLDVTLNAGENSAFTSSGTKTASITMDTGSTIATGGGSLTLDDPGLNVTRHATTVQLAGLDVGGDAAINTFGGALTQIAPIAVDGTLTTATIGGIVTLTDANNAIAKFSGTTATSTSITLTDNLALQLGNVTTGGLTVDTSGANGDVTQIGGTDLTVAGGIVNVSSGSGKIDVGSANSSIRNFYADSTNAVDGVSVESNASLGLGEITAVNVNVLSNDHNVFQATGTHLNISGVLDVTAGAGTINVGATSSSVSGFSAQSSSTAVDAVKLVSHSAVALGDIDAVNATISTSNQNVTQAGGTHLNVTGLLNVAAGTGTINVGNATSTVGGFAASSTATAANAVMLTTNSAVALNNISATNLTVGTTGHNVTQAASTNLTVTGVLDIDAGAGSATVAANANTALGDITATNFTINSNGHNVTQATGTDLAISHELAVISGAGLVNVGNATSTVGIFAATSTATAANAVQLTTNSNVALGNLTAVNAKVTSNSHDVTQATGTHLSVSGLLDVTSGTGLINVGNATSTVAGFNASASANTVALTTNSDVALGNITGTGATITTTGHSLTQATGTHLNVAALGLVLGAGSANVGNATSQVGTLTASSTNTGATGVTVNSGVGDLTLGNINAVNLTVGGNGGNVLQAAATNLNITGQLAVAAGAGNVDVGSTTSTVAKFGATGTSTSVDAVKLTTGSNVALGNVGVVNLTVDSNGHAITQQASTNLAISGLLNVDAGAGKIAVGSAGSTVAHLEANSTATTSDAVQATTNSALILAGLSSSGGATIVTNGHDLTQSAAVDVAGTLNTDTGAGVVHLASQATNTVGRFDATSTNTAAGAVALLVDGNVALGNVHAVNASIDSTGAGGADITQATGTHLAVTGLLSLHAGTGAIAVGDSTSTINHFDASSTNAAGIRVDAGSNVAIGLVTGAPSLAVDAHGHAVTQVSGTALNVAGVVDVSGSTVNIGSATSTIGTYTGTSTAAGGTTVTTGHDLLLGAVGAQNLTVASNGGNVGQAAATNLNVSGIASITAGAGSIAIGSAASTVGGFAASTTNASGASLTTNSAVALGNISAPVLTVATNGHDVTQAGGTNLNVSGVATITADAGKIAIGSAGSTVGILDATSTNAAGVSFDAGSSVVLGTISAPTLVVNSHGHDVLQAAATNLGVSGVVNITAGAGMVDIGSSGSTIGTFVATSTNASGAAVTTGADLMVGAVSAPTLVVNTGGHALSQASGTDLAVSGIVSATTGAGALSLGSVHSTIGQLNASTTNAGGVNVDTGSNVALGVITGAPSLTLDAHGHAITQAAGTDVNIAGTVSVSGSTVDIGSAASTIGTFESTTTGAGGATVTTGAALGLGAITGQNLTVNSNGADVGQAASTNLNVSGTVAVSSGAGLIAVGGAGSTIGTFVASTTNVAGASVETNSALALGAVSAPVLTVTTHGHDVTQANASNLNVSGLATITSGAGKVAIGSAGSTVGGFAATTTNTAGASIVTGSAVALGAISAPKLTVDSNGHDVTQLASTNLGVTGAATIAAGAGLIDVGSSTSTIGTFVATSTNAAGATVTTGADLMLGAVSAPTLTVDTTGHALSQASGTDLQVSGVATLSTGSATLDVGSAASAIGTFAVPSAGDVTVTTGGALQLGDITAASLATNAGGDVTQAGGSALTIAGAANFGSTNNVGTGTHDVTITNAGNTFASFGADTTGTVRITDAADLQLGNVTAGTLIVDTQVGDHAVSQVTGTAVNVSGTMTVSAGAGLVTLTRANTIHEFGGSGGTVQVTTGGPLTLDNLAASSLVVDTSAANGSITQAGGTAVSSGAVTLHAGTGDITLSEPGNAIGAFAGTGHDIVLTDTSAVALGNVSAHTLAIDTSAANASVSQTGGTALVIAGATTVKSGDGSIVLDQQNHLSSFGTGTPSGSPSAAAITVVNTGPLLLNDVNAGSLTLTTNGALTQAGGAALTVAGTTTIDATVSGDVTLANATNDFGGTVNVQGNKITLRDANDLSLGTLQSNQATGGISLTAGGQLNTVSGDIDAGAGDLTLSSGAALATSGSLHGHDVTLSGSAVTLGGDVGATGDLTVNSSGQAGAAGAITQSAGAVTVVGNTQLLAGAGDVSLGSSANAFQGGLVVNGGAVLVNASGSLSAQVQSAGNATIGTSGDLAVHGQSGGSLTTSGTTISLGAIGTTGDFAATASNGTVTQTDDLQVGGHSLIAATGDVALARSTNAFTGSITVSGANVSLADTGTLAAHVTSTGDAALTAPGQLSVDGAIGGALDAHGAGITQSAALTVAGTSTLDAAGHTLSLGKAGNDFGGLVDVTAGPVTLADVSALNVKLNGTGATTLTAGGVASVSGSTTGALGVHGNGIAFGATQVGGALTATSDSGAVTQSAALHVAGASTLGAGTGTLVLTNAGNSFGGAVTLSGAHLEVSQAGALAVHLAGAGDATVASTAGALTVDGTATGDLAANGSTVAFGATSIGGALAATAGDGAITQTGDLAVTGASTLDAGSHDVTLSGSGNVFTGVVTVTGATVALHDANALTTHVGAANNATLDAGGALTVDGHVGGDLAASGNSVAFGAGATSVAGKLAVTTHGVALASAQSANGTTPQAAASGSITQTGDLTVGDTTVLQAGGGDITLTNAGNSLAGDVTAHGNDISITNTKAMNAVVDASGDTTLVTTAALNAQGSFGGALTATGSEVLIGRNTSDAALNLGGALTATATSGNVTLGYIHATGGDVAATGGEVLLDGTLGLSGDMTLSGTSIRGLGSHGALDAGTNVKVTLTATSGNIGRSPDSIPGQLDPVGAITLLNQTGQGTSGFVAVNLLAPGTTAWFGVTSRSQFQGLQIVEDPTLNSSTFGCDAVSCFNILGQTGALADSVIANILRAASQDTADAAFGTENLDIAIRKGYVTTIGRVPPGIDEIADDLGSTVCDPRVTSEGSIRANKACTVEAPKSRSRATPLGGVETPSN